MFDAVLVHDAVDYVTDTDDLRQLIATAFAHCRPGGMAVFVPDYTAETFQAGTGGGGSTDASGRQGSFREWTWDPDPGDDWIRVEYEFTLREADGIGPGGPRGPPAGRVPPRPVAAPAGGRWIRAGNAVRWREPGRPGADEGMPAHLFIGRRPR